MRFLSEIARRWADKRLTKELGEVHFKLTNANAAKKRLLQQRNEADAAVNRLEASVTTFGNAVRSLQSNLGAEQELTELLASERDEARRQAADLAAENVILTDAKRHLEASLSGAREELRQVRREHALAEEAVAELRVTADGLGLAMADLERRERKDFLDEDHRHVRLMDGAEDHL